ncbi:hypothetical protein IZ6_10620 [Terrihabitans soli]|uniref:Uncharacterized protein n=1 Tax=Terrihabitans soli TaxID=708113 RepID=A0A6S6QQT2_9HYPH|nr:hypothetical protein [Terrihabitans soli]BCJ90327.1 hypothetical protein IZ6_10620 [Terrihabitans soli]
MSHDTWVEFTACIEKQIEANERAIRQLSQSGATHIGSKDPQNVINGLKGNNAQLRALAERSRAKAAR